MDRRTFLTAMLGVAGAAAAVGVIGPQEALAGVPNGRGILDEIDEPIEGMASPDAEATVQPVWHRRWHQRRPRRRRRWVTRRVCRRYWRNGRRQVRCWRERVRVWTW